MLFDTLQQYDDEIATVRPLLLAAMQNQASMSGGAAAGMHLQKGNVGEIQRYLAQLSKERDIIQNRVQSDTVNRAQFVRER